MLLAFSSGILSVLAPVPAIAEKPVLMDRSFGASKVTVIVLRLMGAVHGVLWGVRRNPQLTALEFNHCVGSYRYFWPVMVSRRSVINSTAHVLMPRAEKGCMLRGLFNILLVLRSLPAGLLAQRTGVMPVEGWLRLKAELDFRLYRE